MANENYQERKDDSYFSDVIMKETNKQNIAQKPAISGNSRKLCFPRVIACFICTSCIQLVHQKALLSDCSKQENTSKSNKKASANYKGQMFIIASVLVLVGLVLIFNILGIQTITEEKRSQDSRLADKIARNIMAEYMFLTGTATAKQEVNKSAADFAANFSAYIRSEMPSNIFYAIAFVNGTTQKYSINVGNYLDRKINITVNVTDSTPLGNNALLDDMKNLTFHFSSSINGTINVTINYKTGNRDVTEKFGINSSAKNFIMAFFDITVIDGDSHINIKDTYNRTWS